MISFVISFANALTLTRLPNSPRAVIISNLHDRVHQLIPSRCLCFYSILHVPIRKFHPLHPEHQLSHHAKADAHPQGCPPTHLTSSQRKAQTNHRRRPLKTHQKNQARTSNNFPLLQTLTSRLNRRHDPAALPHSRLNHNALPKTRLDSPLPSPSWALHDIWRSLQISVFISKGGRQCVEEESICT